MTGSGENEAVTYNSAAPVMRALTGAPLPEVIYLELADYCNLNCVFCGRENEVRDLRGGDVGGFADLDKLKMLERPLRSAKFLGLSGRIGEPLIYPQLGAFLQWVYSINPTIKLRITTNGTALSRKIADLLRGHIDFLAISLNASNPGAYVRDMRPVGHRVGTDWTPNWNNFIRRITEFIEALPPDEREQVRIIAPVHRDNIDDVPNFVTLVASIGCTHAILTPMHIHDEANIDLSVYWLKDKYNDIIDDITASAAKQGVKVEAARFYSTVKTGLSIDVLCHEPSEVAYLNMGTQWKGAPCCQWTERFIPIDVYSDHGAFDRFWNSDLYRRLRAKRDFESCKACGLTRTFDEMMFHFTPLLKSRLIESKRIAEAELRSIYDDQEVVRACRALSLDLRSLRRTFTGLGLSTDRLRCIETEGVAALPTLDRDCWDAFLKSDAAPEPAIDLTLGGCFTGFGWFEPDCDPGAKVAARWMGGGRVASVYFRVQPRQEYRIRLTAHHVSSAEMANGLSLMIAGCPLDIEQSTPNKEGIAILTAVMSEELATIHGGRIWLSIGYSDNHGHEGWVSFSQLEVTPIAARASWVMQQLKRFH